MIRFGSVCSGIEAASVAWLPLGWECAWVSEIEPFPSAVLAHHYPDVPNLGDMTELDPEECADIDVLVGGTPCQSFSVAGLRKGLQDERGNLTLSFVRLAEAIDAVRLRRGQPPIVIVWENVPGVLSHGDNPLGCLLGALAGEDDPLVPSGERWTHAGVVLGPARTIAWRVLDAQHFGLAQRRKRVFVVASARAGFDPGEVLLECEGMRGDHPSGEEARERTTGTLAGCSPGGGHRVGADEAAAGQLVTEGVPGMLCDADREEEGDPGVAVSRLSDVVTSKWAKGTDGPSGDECQNLVPTLRAGGNRTGGDRPPGTDVDTAESLQVCAFNARQDPDTMSPTLRCGSKGDPPAVLQPSEEPIAFNMRGREEGNVPEVDPDNLANIRAASGGSTRTLVATPDRPEDFFANPRQLRNSESSNQVGLKFDGKSDALCSDGPGAVVHPVAVHENQRGEVETNVLMGSLKCGGGKPGQGFPCISEGSETPEMQGALMRVRRLMPVECERLQGFPEVARTVTIVVCSDRQNNDAAVGQRCPKLPNNVSRVDARKSPGSVRSVVGHSVVPHPDQRERVGVSALINCEPEPRLRLRIGKWSLSVNGVDIESACHRLMLPGGFVHTLALMLHKLGRAVPNGKAESHQSNNCFSQAKNGNHVVNLYGPEIEEHAGGAAQCIQQLIQHSTSTTSEVGSSFQNSGLNLAILCSYVWTVIGSFIPAEIQHANSFVCDLTVSSGWTQIPWRGKPPSECPDGPRYMAIGNSMAVPVMRWIGERIDSEMKRGGR